MIKKYSGLIGNIILICGIFILLGLLFKEKRGKEELQELNRVANQELVLSKNEKGELVGTIEAFQTEKTKTFLEFKTKDSTILKLQEDVKAMKKQLRKQGSVTRFSTETQIDVVAETEVDTSNIDTTSRYIYPIYRSKFNLDGWVMGRSVAAKDSTTYDLWYKDEYSVAIGLDGGGMFKKAKPFAKVTSSNPYNVIKTMRAYQVTLPPRKLLSLAPSFNVGYGFDGKLYGTFGLSLQLEKLAIKF